MKNRNLLAAFVLLSLVLWRVGYLSNQIRPQKLANFELETVSPVEDALQVSPSGALALMNVGIAYHSKWQVVETSSGRLVYEFKSSPVCELAFLPDDTGLAILDFSTPPPRAPRGRAYQPRFVDFRSGQITYGQEVTVKRFNLPRDLAVSPNGKSLLALFAPGVFEWDLSSHRLRHNYKVGDPIGEDILVDEVWKISSETDNGRLLYVQTSFFGLKCWDVLQERKILEAPGLEVETNTHSADLRQAMASYSGGVLVGELETNRRFYAAFDLKSGKELWKDYTPRARYQCWLNEVGTKAVFLAGDNLEEREARTGKLIREFPGRVLGTCGQLVGDYFYYVDPQGNLMRQGLH